MMMEKSNKNDSSDIENYKGTQSKGQVQTGARSSLLRHLAT